MTIEDVAHQTRIHHEVVRQLEADDFSSLPGPMFVRSFVHIYCRELDIDPAPLLESLAGTGSEPLRDRSGQYLLGALRAEVRERYGHLSWSLPVRRVLATVALVGVLALSGVYLVDQIYADARPKPPQPAEALPPAPTAEQSGAGATNPQPDDRAIAGEPPPVLPTAGEFGGGDQDEPVEEPPRAEPVGEVESATDEAADPQAAGAAR